MGEKLSGCDGKKLIRIVESGTFNEIEPGDTYPQLLVHLEALRKGYRKGFD